MSIMCSIGVTMETPSTAAITLRISVTDEKREGKEAFRQFDMPKYTKSLFGMFSGEQKDVVLQFDKMLIGPVFDKFGETTPLMLVDETTCTATVQVQVSPTFFGWLAQFGGKMKVLSPESLKLRFREHIYPILE